MARAWAVFGRRAYAILFGCALAFAVGLPAYVVVGRVHDRVVVQRDVDCYERELAALSPRAPPRTDAGLPPKVRTPVLGLEERLGRAPAGQFRPGDTVLLLIGFVVFAGLPWACSSRVARCTGG